MYFIARFTTVHHNYRSSSSLISTSTSYILILLLVDTCISFITLLIANMMQLTMQAIFLEPVTASISAGKDPRSSISIMESLREVILTLCEDKYDTLLPTHQLSSNCIKLSVDSWPRKLGPLGFLALSNTDNVSEL